MVLAMRHGSLPATLHAEQLSPHVDWASGAVSLLTSAQPWPAGSAASGGGVGVRRQRHERARHLEEAPAVRAGRWVPVVDLPVVPVLVSGASEAALRAQAERLRRVVPGVLAVAAAERIRYGSGVAGSGGGVRVGARCWRIGRWCSRVTPRR